MALFYGSVISFWLIHHIINLTFAIFVTAGRPIYRSDERFLIDGDARIKVSNVWYPIILHDISENGISFHSYKPLYIKEKCMVEIATNNEKILIECQVVRVFLKNDNWLYGMKILQLSEEVKKKYFFFLFNRHNDYLTNYRNGWITVMDILSENNIKRLELIKKNLIRNNNKINDIYPKISSKFPIEISNKEALITEFSSEQITFKFKFEVPSSGPIRISLFGQSIVLAELNRNSINNEITYKFVNSSNVDTEVIQLMYLKLWRDKSAIN